MNLLQRILRPKPIDAAARAREGERLNAKRRHLRGKLARNQGELRRMWTEFRTWRGDSAGKKALREKIKHVEAERKEMVRQMMKLHAEMKKVGYDAAAGHVDIS